jgi:hypothetical protein
MPEVSKYSIFVNTCDKFEDCWEPFFKLFAFYWPNYSGKIYLNTDYKEYTYPGLNIISLKNAEIRKDADKITWSECLIRGIDKVETEILLYMQEDYFLKGSVENNVVNQYVNLFSRNDIDCIHLTDQNTGGPITKSSPYPGLWTLKSDCADRISCQAALWRKSTLKQYIRPYESAWNFEEFGTRRAKVLKHNFYTVDRDKVQHEEYEIIPYIFTGIIQGKWYEKVIPLFKVHNINLDYSKRGFVSDTKGKSVTKRIQNQLSKVPVRIKSFFDLWRLKGLNNQ